MLRRPSPTPSRRRPVTLGAALAAASLVLGACATFTDNRAAARVDDATLSLDELDELIIGATPGAEPGERVTVPLPTARNLLNTWILTEVLRGELEAAGRPLTDDDRAVASADLAAQLGADWEIGLTPALRDLQVEQQAAITVWGQTEEEPPGVEQLRASYQRGPVESGIVCVAHILVDTEAEAANVLADLAGGAAFAELAAERSTDLGTAAVGGVLPCSSTNDFVQSVVPEFGEAVIGASIDEPAGPVETMFGFHVIRLRPFEEVSDEGLESIYLSDGVRFRRASRAADVYVDPRYGSFDPDAGVVQIG